VEEFSQFLRLSKVLFLKLNRTGKVVFVNRHTCQALGCRKKDIVGKNWFIHFIPARLRNPVQKVFKRLMNGRLAAVEFFENPVRTKRGQERTIAWHNAIIRDPRGRIVGTLSAGEDITEQRLAERRLAENEEHLRVTLNSAASGFCVGSPHM